MKPTMFYYVHHHGNGHVALFNRLILNLKTIFNVHVLVHDNAIVNKLSDTIPKENIHLLPKKTVDNSSFKHTFSKAFEGVPYSLTSVDRIYALSSLVKAYTPVVSVIDGSAELAITLRSMGIPVVFNRLLGNIAIDPTQMFAYECADVVTAFYPQDIEDEEYKHQAKTTYFGFMSPYSIHPKSNNQVVSIVLGSDDSLENKITSIVSVTDRTFEIIGNMAQKVPASVTYKGFVASIKDSITGEVVISAGGLNTLSELVSLGKKIIILPSSRPYDEQSYNAQALHKARYAINAEHTNDNEWENVIRNAEALSKIYKGPSMEEISITYTNLLRENYGTV